MSQLSILVKQQTDAKRLIEDEDKDKEEEEKEDFESSSHVSDVPEEHVP